MYQKGTSDLALATYALAIDDAEIDVEIIFFHLQQAAEKHLKALLSPELVSKAFSPRTESKGIAEKLNQVYNAHMSRLDPQLLSQAKMFLENRYHGCPRNSTESD